MEPMEAGNIPAGSKFGVGENGQKKYPWKYTADGAIRKKKKPTVAQKNMRFKKVVQPKNAVMCLNELVKNVVYVVEQEGNGAATRCIVSIDVNGDKYRGYGSSKSLAKQAAAEAALVNFIKPTATASEEEDDATPWTTLASFAMFKLLNEWKEGRFGSCPGTFNPLGMNPALSQTLQSLLNNKNIQTAAAAAPQPPKPQAQKPAKVQSEAQNNGEKAVQKRAKALPANATTIHPVMLLHQMRPELVYDQAIVTNNGQQMYNISTYVDGRHFVGEGQNIKKAKYDLAVKCNEGVFGVHTTFQPTQH